MRFDVLGVPIDALDLERATGEVAAMVRGGTRGYVCVTGVHGVMESSRRPEVALAHRQADMVVPDGMPLVWCGRRLGLPVGRVYGPELMPAVIERGLADGWRHAFFGSRPVVLADLVRRLGARFPALVVAGTLAPPFGELGAWDAEDHVESLNAMGADVVWVGLSTPKQELWMHRHRARLRAPVLIGVGAAFDIHAGHLPQAPAALQRRGLEWAYRLAKEPRRLWRRYLRNNPAFLMAIARRPPRVLGSP